MLTFRILRYSEDFAGFWVCLRVRGYFGYEAYSMKTRRPTIPTYEISPTIRRILKHTQTQTYEAYSEALYSPYTLPMPRCVSYTLQAPMDAWSL